MLKTLILAAATSVTLSTNAVEILATAAESREMCELLGEHLLDVKAAKEQL